MTNETLIALESDTKKSISINNKFHLQDTLVTYIS